MTNSTYFNTKPLLCCAFLIIFSLCLCRCSSDSDSNTKIKEEMPPITEGNSNNHDSSVPTIENNTESDPIEPISPTEEDVQNTPLIEKEEPKPTYTKSEPIIEEKNPIKDKPSFSNTRVNNSSNITNSIVPNSSISSNTYTKSDDRKPITKVITPPPSKPTPYSFKESSSELNIVDNSPKPPKKTEPIVIKKPIPKPPKKTEPIVIKKPIPKPPKKTEPIVIKKPTPKPPKKTELKISPPYNYNNTNLADDFMKFDSDFRGRPLENQLKISFVSDSTPIIETGEKKYSLKSYLSHLKMSGPYYVKIDDIQKDGEGRIKSIKLRETPTDGK